MEFSKGIVNDNDFAGYNKDNRLFMERVSNIYRYAFSCLIVFIENNFSLLLKYFGYIFICIAEILHSLYICIEEYPKYVCNGFKNGEKFNVYNKSIISNLKDINNVFTMVISNVLVFVYNIFVGFIMFVYKEYNATIDNINKEIDKMRDIKDNKK